MHIEFILFQLSLFLISLSSNILSALAGGGAGLVQLPLLIFLGLPFPIALATHKVASVSLGIGATIRHLREQTLNPFLAFFLLFTGLPGVSIGTAVVLSLTDQVASIMLGLLTLILGLYSIKQKEFGIADREINQSRRHWIIGGFVLFIIGLVNGSLSSGTGLFVTIWLIRWFGLTYTKAVGYTLIIVGLFWNGTGAALLGINRQVQWSWLPMLILGSTIGGYVGAHLSIQKGNRLVKSIFEFVSITIGLSLVIKGAF